MNKKLYRSNSDKMFAGVCSGVGEYFELDSTLVRLAFVLLSLAYGGGIIAYIVCAIVIPERPAGEKYVKEEAQYYDKDGNPINDKEKKTKKIVGIILLVLGLMLLGENVFMWFDRNIILAIGIIAAGGFLLFRPSSDK